LALSLAHLENCNIEIDDLYSTSIDFARKDLKFTWLQTDMQIKNLSRRIALYVGVSFCPIVLFVCIIADSSRSLETAGLTSSDPIIDTRNWTRDICRISRNVKGNTSFSFDE